jgi:hypothetical protein
MDISKLIEAGPLGVVVLLVIVFIWYIDRRDKSYQESSKQRDTQWQEFTKQQRAEDNGTIRELVIEVKSLTSQLVALRNDFNDHNIWERTVVLENLEKKPPRSRRQSNV